MRHTTEERHTSLYHLLVATTLLNTNNHHRHISSNKTHKLLKHNTDRNNTDRNNNNNNNMSSFSTSYSSSSFLFNAFVIVQLLFIIGSIIPIGHHGNQVECSSLVESNNSNQRSSNNGQGPNRCLNGWLWFNNKCWVASNSRRNFVHAIELCRKMYFDSTLPTIHSEEENEFLRNNIELDTSPIWLYSRHNHQYNRTRWLDKR